MERRMVGGEKWRTIGPRFGDKLPWLLGGPHVVLLDLARIPTIYEAFKMKNNDGSIRRKYEIGDDIPEEITTIAHACTMNFRNSTRILALMATISFLVLTSVLSEHSEFDVFGLRVGENLLYPFFLFMLSLLNISYCAAQQQAHKAHGIFIDLVNDYNAENIYYTNKNTFADAVHTLYVTSPIRIFPIREHLPGFLKFCYPGFKFIIDLFFTFLPLSYV